MTNLRHLIVDLRAHAHEVPEDIGALMRQAATALDQLAPLTDGPQPAPFPPPEPSCHFCSDTGQMIVGQTRSGAVVVASCNCQTKEKADAQG